MAMESEYGGIPSQVIDRIVLRGGLSELSVLAEWVQNLAARNRIDDELQFAFHLCLEEAVSNVIRHGYKAEAIKPVTVAFSQSKERQWTFIVEDFAPPFDPLLVPEMPMLDTDGEPAIGGRGIRLLRAFAHGLEYEKTETGNRLLISFTGNQPFTDSQ
jgi:anti-sigma regulatory factor (Ser/Thr protein kinase)